MPQYLMARHVFLCMQGEHVVFLDVRKDRYFALESARTAGLGHFVPGWPVPARMASDAVHGNCNSAAPALAEQLDHGALSGVISLLLEKGILTIETDGGKPANETVAEPIRGDVGADSLDETPHIGVFRFLRFVSAAVRARLLLKYRTFEVVVERVRRRGESRRASGPSVSESDLQGLVVSFATLRPFFFAARDACLFDALSLSEFLAGYGVYPRWVFGVQSRPFAAHCWLQLDGVVLNDTVDHVKRYTPIMVV
jgi:transglutaminase superfamily protein